MTLQYIISRGQADRAALFGHAPRWTLGGAVVGSIVLHITALAIAVLGFGRHAPAAEDPAAITVFIPPASPQTAATPEAKPAEEPPPPPPEPVPDYAPPPPEEQVAVPDFKVPPPPQAPKRPPSPIRPPVIAAPRPSPPVPAHEPPPPAPVAGAPPATAAPSIVPGWNVQLAAWLAAHKTYPPEARKRGEEGEVLIRFTVETDGHVSAVALAKGSGFADIDRAALAMLQGATLPPPGAPATRTVRVRFHLDD